MALRCFLACFLTSCLVCLVAGQSTQYGLRGQKASLKPDISGQPDGILWKHNGNKVVEFNGQEEHVYKQFKDRITLDWHSAELSISNLRFEDSGEYELEVDINKGLVPSLYKLEVLDKVAKPTITCEMNDGSSSNKSAKLLCSAEPERPQSLMKFEWRSQGVVQRGRELTIPLGGKRDDEVHSCSVSNPLSRESDTFTAKDCYTDSPSLPLTAGLISACVLLFLVGLILLYCKLRKKVCFKEADSEKQPPSEAAAKPLLQSTLPPDQQLHQSNDNEAGMVIEKGHVERAKEKLRAGSGNNSDEPRGAAPCPVPRMTMNNLSPNNKSDEDEEERNEPAEEDPACDLSDSEKANEADPPAAGVSDDEKEDAQSDWEVPTSPHKAENDTREHEKAAPHPLPRTHLAKNNLSPDDKHEENKEELRDSAEEVPKYNPSDSEKPDEADPPAAGDDIREDPQPELEVPTPLTMTGLGNDTDEHTEAAPPSPPSRELREPAEEKTPQRDPPDSEKPDEADPPAAVSDDTREDTQPDLEVPTLSHKTGYVKRTRSLYESKYGEQTSPQKLATEPENVAERNAEDKKLDKEDEEVKSAPPNADTSPAAPPHFPLTVSGGNMTPKHTVGEDKEDANSDEVTEERAEKTVRESDSSGEEERNESDELPEQKQSSIAPEEKSSETTPHEQTLNLSKEATQTGENQQPETVQPVTQNENETDTVNDLAPDEDADLYSDNSQQAPSPVPRKPDKMNTDACAACPDTAEEELMTRHDSAGKSGNDEGCLNENQRGPKEEANESLTEDKKQRKDEVAA